MGEVLRHAITPEKSKNALQLYIRALVQDYYNETGIAIEDINLIYTIKDNKRVVKDVQILTELEVPAS